jgi:hypothetical protein
MARRSVSRRSIRRMPHYDGYPLARLGGELSAVINRVRRAFGPIPMRESASRREVKQAESTVDQTARLFLRGEADLTAWYRALRQYEDAWLAQLDQVRVKNAGRCAA